MTTTPPQAPTRVVIVDDHRVLSELLTDALSAREEINVVGSAGTAALALRTVTAHRPDVVLLDYDLPDADGLSLVQPMLLASPDTRVLMLTSYTEPVILSEAIEVGCAGFVTKRSSVDQIATAILAVCSDETPVSPDMVRSLLINGTDQGGSDLTTREVEVLRLATNGLNNQEIADQLFLSVNTIRNHMQRVLNKLDAHSKLEAVAIAVRRGIVRR